MDGKLEYCTSQNEGLTFHHGIVRSGDKYVSFTTVNGIDQLLKTINRGLENHEIGFQVTALDIVPMTENSKKFFDRLVYS